MDGSRAIPVAAGAGPRGDTTAAARPSVAASTTANHGTCARPPSGRTYTRVAPRTKSARGAHTTSTQALNVPRSPDPDRTQAVTRRSISSAAPRSTQFGARPGADTTTPYRSSRSAIHDS